MGTDPNFCTMHSCNLAKIQAFEALIEKNSINLEVFPNPTQSKVMISAGINEPATITVSDISGRCLRQCYQNGSFELDNSSFASGIYMIKYETNSAKAETKILKL